MRVTVESEGMLGVAFEASAGNRQVFGGPAVAQHGRPHRRLLRVMILSEPWLHICWVKFKRASRCAGELAEWKVWNKLVFMRYRHHIWVTRHVGRLPGQQLFVRSTRQHLI